MLDVFCFCHQADRSTLPSELLEGVTQIVSAVGPVFGRTPDGQMGWVSCEPALPLMWWLLTGRTETCRCTSRHNPAAQGANLAWHDGNNLIKTLSSRYLDNMTSERVDAEGVSNVAELAKKLPQQQPETACVLSMASDKDLEVHLLNAYQRVKLTLDWHSCNHTPH